MTEALVTSVVVVPLKGGYGRKELTYDGQSMTIRFQSIFGKRLFVIPGVQVCVVLPDLSPVDDTGEGWIFEGGIRTATIKSVRWGTPNLCVLLTEPVTVPPLKPLLRLGSELDFKGGDRVDALSLRARDPWEAVHALTMAGVASTDTPTRWLKERRRTTSDPILVDARHRRQHQMRRILNVALVLMTAGAAAMQFIDDTAGFAAGAASVLAGWALIACGARTSRRTVPEHDPASN